MGHIPVSGPEGSIAKLADLKAAKTFIHINNTNPILRDDSPQAQKLKDLGIEIAYDGMHIEV
jgi:pyrroloquinoline quinone biosynthesis protein B